MQIPQACLFDLDGILIDTEKLHGQAWKEASLHFGLTLSQKQLLKLRGRRRSDCLNQIFQWSNENINIEKFIQIHQPISRKLLSKTNSIPGAKDLIKDCAIKKIPTALVTSSSRKSFEFKTAQHPWIQNMNAFVLGDDPDLLKGKPSPYPFLLAAKRLNVDPSKCWAFEDSESGTKSALGAGCKVWVLLDSQHKDKFINIDLNSNPIYIKELGCINEQLKYN